MWRVTSGFMCSVRLSAYCLFSNCLFICSFFCIIYIYIVDQNTCSNYVIAGSYFNMFSNKCLLFFHVRRAEAWPSSSGKERRKRKWSGPVTRWTMNIWAGGLQSVSGNYGCFMYRCVFVRSHSWLVCVCCLLYWELMLSVSINVSQCILNY